VAGLGGGGKGMFWANVVGDLTRGRPALGLDYTAPGAVEVLLIGCEDGYADTVNPRLLAAGADLKKVHILTGVKNARGKILPFSLNWPAPHFLVQR
jgi:putative DNA primase/helicase